MSPYSRRSKSFLNNVLEDLESKKTSGSDGFQNMGSEASGSSSHLNSKKSGRKSGYTQIIKQRQNQEHEGGDENWLVSYADMMTLLFGFFVLLMSFSKLDLEKFEKARQETTQFFGGEYKVPFEKFKNELMAEIKKENLTNQVVLKVDEKGVIITFRGALFFDLGASEVRPEAITILDRIIPVIKKQTSIFTVQIEGHTDDNPISDSKFPSNWELSAFRAVNVLHYFERAGFSKENLQATGFGETQPIVPNRNPKGEPIKENQAQNRRVVIRLIRAQL